MAPGTVTFSEVLVKLNRWLSVPALLAALAFGGGLQIVTAPAASAVGCSGVGCDNLGPKGNGCFNDQKVLASGSSNYTRLYYSDACHAMWAWSKNGARDWDTQIQLEMEEYVQLDSVTYVWKFRKRLIATKGYEEASDWTNALGARTSKFRFRAIWADPFGGLPMVATPWALGGNR